MPKRNLRKVPPEVRSRIATLAVDDVVCACVKRISVADIANYADLGIALENGRLVLPSPRVPPANMGKYCNVNVNGKEVVRRDLPMVTKTVFFDAPSWGSHYATHAVGVDRQVYERDFIPPKELTLSVELLDFGSGQHFTVKFQVDQVLSAASPDFDDDLLYNLNILQENVGAADVFASTATLADYVATIRLDWEILPPGTVDDVLRGILRGKPPISKAKQDVMKERLGAMSRLKPLHYIAGTNEFLRYFGAMFEDDFVAFDNVNYGNALYVMYENWETLSRRSRLDLLKGHREGFERITHRPGWEDELEHLLKNHRKVPRVNR